MKQINKLYLFCNFLSVHTKSHNLLLSVFNLNLWENVTTKHRFLSLKLSLIYLCCNAYSHFTHKINTIIHFLLLLLRCICKPHIENKSYKGKQNNNKNKQYKTKTKKQKIECQQTIFQLTSPGLSFTQKLFLLQDIFRILGQANRLILNLSLQTRSPFSQTPTMISTPSAS